MSYDISQTLAFANNSITVYKYESFKYTISNPVVYVPTTTVSPGIPPALVVSDANKVVFSSLGFNGATSTGESIVIDVCGSQSSNTVGIAAGRFRDSNGDSMSNTVFTFYKNEAITPATFNASINLTAPLLTFPALPSGLTLTKTGAKQFTLAGTPVVQTPSSNYQIIGQGSNTDAGKIVTTVNAIAVAAERVQLSLSGSPVVSGMLIGTPISQRSLYAKYPLASSGNLRYTWTSLPDGIYFGDKFGTPVSSGFQPLSDASYTLTLQGTPSLNAAKAFAAANVTSCNVLVEALRLTTPVISNTTFYTFQFSPTVLFDDVSIPTLYTGIAVDPSQTSFFAKTYFGSDASISTIFSPDLRSDLSLNFVSAQARAYLFAPSGSPTSAGTGSFTIRAINALGVERDLTTTLSVVNPTVTFDYATTPAMDTCYSFVLSRPVSLAKTGYYPFPIHFKVSTLPASLPVSFSAPSLAGTGLTLSNVSANVVQIDGTPDTITPLSTITVIADASVASASTDISVAVLADTFSFTGIGTLSFAQNREMTPIQVTATSVLAERPIISYSATGLPLGISISPGGLLSGTPLSDVSGTAIITVSTGYASGSASYPYEMITDSMLFTTPQPIYTYTAGESLSIPVLAKTFSGRATSNYGFSLDPSLGAVMNSTTGIISGTWTSGVPPAPLLPTFSNCFLSGQAGDFTGVSPVQMTANPVVANGMVLSLQGERRTDVSGSSFPNESWLWYINSTTPPTLSYVSNSFAGNTPLSDIAIKTNDPSNNLLLTVGGGSYGRTTILADPTYTQFEPNPPLFPSYFSSIVNVPGTSTWWAGGRKYIDASFSIQAVLIKSTDDGATWDISGAIVPSLSTVFCNAPQTRDSNGLAPVSLYDQYLLGGLALAYKSGTFLVGGLPRQGGGAASMVRSTNGGSSWSSVTGAFLGECSAFNVDDPTVWVAAGSDAYRTITGNGWTTSTPTLKYSTDSGASWSNASGDFNMYAYDIAYSDGTWMATGVYSFLSGPTTVYRPQVKYSTDGSNWIPADLSTNPLFLEESNAPLSVPLRIARPTSDGTYWYVPVNPNLDASSSEPLQLYRHDMVSPLTNGWVKYDVSVSQTTTVDSTARFHGTTSARYMYTGTPPTTISLNFAPPSGPIVTSPASSSFLLYKYVQIDPIQLSATGTGQVYFFITAEDLPAGLVFDPLTGRISGTPTQVGTVSTTVSVKDSVGVAQLTLTFTTILPRIVRTQTSASAYTSLLRQYTDVLGAQNARDNRVFPAVDRILGEFTSPYPPNVVTQTVDPNCFGQCK